jgi:hypothetical protein
MRKYPTAQQPLSFESPEKFVYNKGDRNLLYGHPLHVEILKLSPRSEDPVIVSSMKLIHLHCTGSTPCLLAAEARAYMRFDQMPLVSKYAPGTISSCFYCPLSPCNHAVNNCFF